MPKLLVIICGQGVHWVHASGGHIWVHDPTTVRVCFNALDSGYHQRQNRCPESELTHETMWVPENYAAAGAMQIRVACAASWDHVDIWSELLLLAIFESMVLAITWGWWPLLFLPWGPMGTRFWTMYWNRMVLLSFTHPSLRPSLGWYIKLDDPSMGELVTPQIGDTHTWKCWSHPSPWVWESWYHTSPIGDGPRSLDSATIQLHIHVFELAHPQIYPIYDLLEYMKRLVLRESSCGVRTTQGNSRISKRNFG